MFVLVTSLSATMGLLLRRTLQRLVRYAALQHGTVELIENIEAITTTAAFIKRLLW
jgi:hypothetical protein